MPTISLVLLLVTCLYMTWNNYRLGGANLVTQGITGGGKFLLGIMPIMLIFSIISGQVSARNKAVPGLMTEKLAGKSIINAVTAGITTAGGSTLGPVLQDKWANGGNKLAIIGCLISISLLNWTTLLFRISFFGEKLTLVVMGVGALITLATIGLLMIIQRLMG